MCMVLASTTRPQLTMWVHTMSRRLRLRSRIPSDHNGTGTSWVAEGALWAGEEELDYPSSLLGGDAGLVSIIDALRRKNNLMIEV